MITMPDFFGGVINLSGETFTKHFDEFIALYFIIGRDSNSVTCYESSDILTLKIEPQSKEDEINLSRIGSRVRFTSNENGNILLSLSKVDGSIIATLESE